MKKVIPAILLLFFWVNILNAQIIDRRIQIVEIDGVNLVCKFQLATDKDSVAVGNVVSRLRYNPLYFSFSQKPKVIKDFMFHNFENSSYRASVSQPIPGTISVNIVYGGNFPYLLREEFTDVVSVNMKINTILRDTIFVQSLQQFFTPLSTQMLDVGSLSISSLSEEFIPEPTFPFQDAVFTSRDVICKWRDVPRAESFQIEVSTNPSFTEIEQFIDEIIETEVKVKNLKDGTRYYWRVRAVVADKHSHFSRRRSFVVTIPPPSDLSLSTSANTGFVQLNWVNNSSLASNIVIERRSVDSDNSSYEVVDTIDAKRTSYIDALIEKDQKYIYRVRAINKVVSSSCSDSSEISILEKVVSAYNKIPNEFKLQQNYPNPFNPQTTISYSVKEESHITISIYSMLGEKILDLVDKHQNAGRYDIVWDASNYPSGIYIYNMTAKSNTSDNIFQNVKKMILLK